MREAGRLEPANDPPPFWRTSLFALAAIAFLGPTSHRVVADARALQGVRLSTPARLSASGMSAGLGWAAPEPVSLRPAPAIGRPVTFRLLAPAAREVAVGGTFNDFDPAKSPLTRTEEGVWETTLEVPPGQVEYRFRVDGEWRLDPTNPDRTPLPKEFSILEVR